MVVHVPVGSLQDALQSQAGPEELRLAAGMHFIEHPLLLKRGSNAAALVGVGVGRTIISGGIQLAPWGRRPNSTLWSTPLPKHGSPRQLWVGGIRARPARMPVSTNEFLYWRSALPEPFSRHGLVYEAGQGLEQFGAEDLIGAHAIVFFSWTASHHRVVAHDRRHRTLVFDRPTRQPLGHHLPQSGRRFLLEFAAALDAPNDFAVHEGSIGAEDGRITYRPPMGVSDPNDLGASFIARRGLTTLLSIEGEARDDDNADADWDDLDDDLEAASDTWLQGVRVENLTLAHTDWLLPGNESAETTIKALTGTDKIDATAAALVGDLLMADWQAAAFLTDAALMVRHAHGTRVTNVEIRSTGGYAVWLVNGHDNALESCTMQDLGAGGVRIGGMDLSKREARRESALAASRNNSLLRSRILNGGHVFREGVGVLVHRSQHNLIEGNGMRIEPPPATDGTATPCRSQAVRLRMLAHVWCLDGRGGASFVHRD